MTDDDALLGQLRSLASDLDPVPPDVMTAARAAIDLRTLDGELADLVADSAAADVPDLAYAPTRDSATEDRMLSFDGGGVHIDIEVVQEDDVLTVVGQLTGADPGDCVLERGDGSTVPVRLDELGRFMLAGVPAGPVRLHCRSPHGHRVRTVWIGL